MSHTGGDSTRWIAAFDGGGSKIAAAIAPAFASGDLNRDAATTFRQVAAGSGSATTTGWPIARKNLIAAFTKLLAMAAISPVQLDHVVLMLAGAGRAEDVARITKSLSQDPLFGACGRLTVTSDVRPLLIHARDLLPTLPSIVLISGTGSLVAGLDVNEREIRSGGWGPVLGDEGSGWRIALTAIKLLCDMVDADMLNEDTRNILELVKRFAVEKHLVSAPLQLDKQLNSVLLALAHDRHLAAQLAPVILEMSSHQTGVAALKIVRDQIHQLANQVEVVHRRLVISHDSWRLCLAGGLASNHQQFQVLLSEALMQRRLTPAYVEILDPLEAALNFAAKC